MFVVCRLTALAVAALLTSAQGARKIDAKAGSKLAADKKLQAEMKAVNQDAPNFPAPHNDLHIGAAISGGGSRALAFTMGVLRALDGLGLMSRVDALSSVSGGSWAVGPYMFADMEATKLLGRFTEPKDLTLQVLDTRDGALTDTVNSSTKLRLLAYAAAYPPHEVWERLVATTILSPFGLGSRDLYMAASASHVSKICAANPQLSPNQFITPRPNRPKVFIMGGAVAAPSGMTNDMGNLYGLQMSADYSGSPFWPDYNGSLQRVNYTSSEDKLPVTKIQNVARGGGLIESFAFGGGSPSGQQSRSEAVTVAPPKQPLSLATAVGISSAVFGYVRRNMWPVVPEDVVQESEIEHEFADGGFIENSGHLALLQRGVTRLVSVFSTGIPMDPEVDFCAPRSEAEWLELMGDCAHVECAMTSLFGYRYDSDTFFFDHNQVFDRADMPPLLCTLQNLRQSGKPTVTVATLRLQKNTWWGIQGGYDVKLLVVLNEVCTDFEQSLPSETQDALKTDERFERHPHYSTSENSDPMYLKLITANLLSAQSEYFVRQNADLFRQFLEEPNIPGPRPNLGFTPHKYHSHEWYVYHNVVPPTTIAPGTMAPIAPHYDVASQGAMAPFGGMKSVNVKNINGAGPFRLGIAPLPVAMRGLFWLSGQADSSAIMSFAGPTGDGGGVSTGSLRADGNTARYDVRVAGDRVWGFADKTGDSWSNVEKSDLVYHFVFDDVQNPKNGSILPEFFGKVVDQTWLLHFRILLMEEGHDDYPGSVVWSRPSDMFGNQVGQYDLVQVMNEDGERIEPAWTKFVEYQNSETAGTSPGQIFYHDMSR